MKNNVSPKLYVGTLLIICNVLFYFICLPTSLWAFSETNKSGSRAGAISLPGAGGSIQKQRGDLTYDIFTGNTGFKVPLDLPMGTAGFSPDLNLGYNYMGGNGPFGLGWDIAISKISRSFLNGVPNYELDSEGRFNDIITFNGTHLVFYKESEGELYYRLEKDSGFTDLIYTEKPIKLFDREYSGGWKVQYADGKTDYFVNHTCFVESDLLSEGNSCDDGTVAKDTKILSWFLAASSDTNGNLISYFYKYNSGEIVIDKIQYGGKSGDVVTIKFYTLENDRPDPTFDYKAGFKRTNVNLYSNINVYLRDVLIRKYCFIYRPGFKSEDYPSGLLHCPDCTPKDDSLSTQPASSDPENKALHAITYLDKILSVSEEKPYKDCSLSHPEMAFRYSSWFTSDVLGTQKKLVYPVRGFNGKLNSSSLYFNELLDVNSDGLPDIISNTGTQLKVLENPGQLGRDIDINFVGVSSLTFPVSLGSDKQNLADMNGDGVIDYILIQSGALVYYPGSGDEEVFKETSISIDLPDSWNEGRFQGKKSRVLDINGDGFADVISAYMYSGKLYYDCLLNRKGEKFDSFISPMDKEPLSGNSASYFSNRWVRMSDANGDGLLDIIHLETNGIRIYYNKGTFSKPDEPLFGVAFKTSDNLGGHFISILDSTGYDLKRSWFIDANGDGLVDMVGLNRDNSYEVHIRLNKGLGQFNSDIDYKMQVRDFPISNNPGKTRISDIDGDGQQELLFASGPNVYMLDFNRQEDTEGSAPEVKQLVKAGLMVMAKYESGQRIDLQYVTSTDEYLRDLKAGRTNETKLPFPVILVKRVAITEGKTKKNFIDPMKAKVQEYLYHNGFYYKDRRAFLGFNEVESLEYGDDSQEMIYKKSIYHNGSLGYEDFLKSGLEKEGIISKLSDPFYKNIEVDTTVLDFESAFVHSLSSYALMQPLPSLPEHYMQTNSNEYVAEKRPTNDYFIYPRLQKVFKINGSSEIGSTVQTARDIDKYGNVIEELVTSITNGEFASTKTRLTNKKYSQIDQELIAFHIFDVPSRITVIGTNGKTLQDVQMKYDKNGHAINKDQWVLDDQNAQSTFTYDDFGNQISRTEPNGAINTITYDLDGINPTKTENALKHELKLYYTCENLPSYDHFFPDFKCFSRGLITMAVDENNIKRIFEYDSLDRITRVVAENGKHVTFDYERGHNGLPNRTMESTLISTDPHRWFKKVYFRRPNGNKLGIAAQARDDKIRIHDRVEYNRRSEIFKKYVPYISNISVDDVFSSGLLPGPTVGTKTIFSKFDVLGREIKTNYPNGKQEIFEFNPYGYTLTTNYPTADGIIKTTKFRNFTDANEDIVAIENPFGGKVSVERDELGRAIKLYNANGKESTKSYNGLSKLIELRDPHIGVNKYNYDNNGNLISQKLYTSDNDHKGTITFKYDPLNRITEKKYNDQVIETYIYDSKVSHPDKNICDLDSPDYQFNIGKATEVHINDSYFPLTILTGYNRGGQLACEKRIYLQPESERVFSQKMEYDFFDRNVRLTDTHNFIHEYEHGEDNYLNSVTDVISYLDYNEKGQIKTVQFKDEKLSTNYIYDENTLRVTGINTVTNSGEILQDLHYRLDGQDNIEEVIDNLPSENSPDGHLNMSAKYTYDQMSQLTSFERNGKLNRFEYDKFYNFKLNETFSENEFQHDNERLYLPLGTEDKSYKYDGRGNLIESPNLKELVWDLDGRLKKASTQDGKEISYSYDHAGLRYAKRIKLNDNDNVYRLYPFKEAYVENELPVSFIYAGGERLARVEHRESGKKMFWYLRDHLTGSNIVIDSDNLTIVEQIGYYPYGTEYRNADQSHPNQDITFRFSGNYFDFDTDLYYLKTRYFDPNLGRFISPDPLYLENWEKGLQSIIELNLYQYAANNPMKYVDPTGKYIRVRRTVNEGRTTYDVHITAVLVNETGRNISRRELGQIRDSMRRGIESSYSRRYGGNVRVNAHANIIVAHPSISQRSRQEEAAGGARSQVLRRAFGQRHVIHLVNSVPGGSVNTIGRGPFGRREIYINQSILGNASGSALGSIEKTVPHEFGHSATLRHPNDPSNTLTDVSGANNLMWQTQYHPGGMTVTLSQIRQMFNAYQAGSLNRD